MRLLLCCIAIALSIFLLILLISFILFCLVFYSPRKKKTSADNYEIPKGEIYEPFREELVNWIKSTRGTPHDDIYITSFDSLTLHGKYYEYKAGAPMEILFHGYRGTAERDLSGAVERCFALGRNALIVDQRGSGESEGRIITFGIKEHRDCLKWVEYAVSRFGKDVKIILTGISMGASTVIMAAGNPLPANVVSLLADCPFTSAKEIINKVICDLKLPSRFIYPFIRFGARFFGGFDIEETSPIEAIKNCNLPILFFHGDTDAFVPMEMSSKLFNESPVTQKRFVAVQGAGHGLAYPVDKEGYLQTMRETAEEWNIK